MVAQGTTLAARYRLDVRIGAGGMGEVWRGEDTVLARTVAVKVLLPGRLDEPGFAVRFQGEARAMATVNHPGVVDVYDYGVTDVPGAGATAFLVMRFVDGEPLDRLLSRLGRISPEPAMELIAQAASALHAVHGRGIVHRDVKPGNLLVRSDGTLVLTDFGIARADAASRLTDAGMVLGTAAYCAPEQAEGAQATAAVDIYALGVVAYECVAGRRPFDGDTPVTIALKHIREEPPPLPPDVPAAVRQVVERALEKDPARRWPSAAAMSQAAQLAASLSQTVHHTGRHSAHAAAQHAAQHGPAQHGAAQPQPQHMAAHPTGQHATGALHTADHGNHLGYAGHQPAQSAAAALTDVPITAATAAQAQEPVTYRVSSGAWTEGHAVAPAAPTTAVVTPSRPHRTGRRKGPIVAAATATFAVFVGLGAVMYNNIASAGSGGEPAQSAGPLTVVPNSPSPSPSASRSRPPRSATPTPRVSPSRSPSRKPSPTPSPSRSVSPSPSPSRSVPLLKVPALKGLTESGASSAITKSGFKPGVRYSGSGACTGLVTAQSPAAGTSQPKGSTVRITVQKKSCEPSSSPSPSPTPSPSLTS